MAARLHLVSVALIVAVALIGGVAMQLELWRPGILWGVETYSRMLGIHSVAWLALGGPALAGCFGDVAITRLVGANRRRHDATTALAYAALGLWVIGVAATVVTLSRQIDTDWSLFVPDSQQLVTGAPFSRTARATGILSLAAAALLHAVRLGVMIWRQRAIAEPRVMLAVTLVIAIVVACVATLLELHAPSPAFVQATAAFVALVLVIAALDSGERRILPLIAIACAALWAFTPLRVFGVGFVALVIALAFANSASPSARRPIALVVLGLAPILLVQIGARVVLDATSADISVHDTHFVVGEHHSFGAVIAFAWLASLHAGGSTLLGRIPNTVLAWIGAGVASAGSLLHLSASLWLGLRGMPRRYYDYDPDFRSGHLLAGVATGIALAGVVILALGWLLGRLPPRE